MTSTCAPGKVTFAPVIAVPYIKDKLIVSSLAAADLNGDGKTDLILGHRDSNYLEVMLSKGNGTFEPGTKIEERLGGYALVAADFDGDCAPDILAGAFPKVAENDHEGELDRNVDNTTVLLAGKGNGTFRPGTYTLLEDTNLYHLVAADFNADGKLDFAYFGNRDSSAPKIVLNKGKGKFTGLKAGSDESKVFSAGDLTGDGAAELVMWQQDFGESNLCVSANTGKAQFAQPVCYPLSKGVEVQAIAITDVNGDGRNDLVSAGNSSSGEGGTLFDVFLNKGDGSFADRASYFVPIVDGATSVSDVDNDGRPDLVVYHAGDPPTLGILKNKGDGTFVAKPEKYSFGATDSSNPETFVTGDFNGNGLIGFATVDRMKRVVSVITASCAP